MVDQVLSTLTLWLVTIEVLPVTLERVDGSAFSIHYHLLASNDWRVTSDLRESWW